MPNTQWEYMIYRSNWYPQEDKLNELGAQGWQLVAFDPMNEFITAYFKREINKGRE